MCLGAHSKASDDAVNVLLILLAMLACMWMQAWAVVPATTLPSPAAGAHPSTLVPKACALQKSPFNSVPNPQSPSPLFFKLYYYSLGIPTACSHCHSAAALFLPSRQPVCHDPWAYANTNPPPPCNLMLHPSCTSRMNSTPNRLTAYCVRSALVPSSAP